MDVAQIFDRHRSQVVNAEVLNAMTQAQLSEVDRSWSAYRKRVHRRSTTNWKWGRKVLQPGGYEVLGLRSSDAVQGLLMLNQEPVECRGVDGPDTQLLYVEYLEVAPWNVAESSDANRRYSGVGLALLTAAAQVSLKFGCEGRLGLHSLPESEWFYRNRFVDMGIGQGENLRYFELDTYGARQLLKGG